MLMYFPVHVRVSVCVNVSVDFGVDFGRQCGSSLAEEQLLLCQILLIVHGAHAVFLWAGAVGGCSGAAQPLPLSVRRSVGGVQHLRPCWSGARRRTVLSTLAKPQQRRAKDENYSSRDANDDGPGEGAGGRGENRCHGRLCVCKREKRNKKQAL